MRHSVWFPLTAGALALATLAGCQAAGSPATGPVSGPPQSLLAAPAATPGAEARYGFLSGVGLTAAQQASIKAIAERRGTTTALGDARTRAERFATLMKAPVLDEAALAAFLREGLEASVQGRTGLVSDYADVREVLTPAQRTAAADAIQAQLDRPATPPSAPPEEGGGQNGSGGQSAQPPQQMEPLTEQQQALFAATLVPPPDPRAVLQAIATLMRTGDKAALETALAPRLSVGAQVKALVRAFASLTPTQRRQLAGPGA